MKFFLRRETKYVCRTSNLCKTDRRNVSCPGNRRGCRPADGKDNMKKEQLGELIIASEDMMYHVARTLLNNDADCADAIQEAIVRAFSKLHTLKKDDYAKTWLTRILINECYGILRARKRMAPLEEWAMDDRGTENQDYSDLYEALSRLPEDTRLTVVLYYVEGYSIREIAGIQETTESAVKNRLARARKRLRKDLEGEGAAI